MLFLRKNVLSVYHLQTYPELNFGWTVNGKAILVCPAENFRSKRNLLSGSPFQNFQPEYPNGKLCSIYFFLPVPGPAPIDKLGLESL